MALKSNRRAPARGRGFFAWSAGAALLATTLLATNWALAGDVTIDSLAFKSFDGNSFAFAHVEFTNTNLSKDEIVKLLTPDTLADDDRALAQKLKAEKIAIASIDIIGKDGSKIRLNGLTASHVDGGRIEALDLAGIDASGIENGGPVSVKSGALHLDGLDVAPLLAAGDSPDPSGPPSRLGGMTLAGLDVVTPDPENAPGETLHVALGSIDVHNDYAGDTLKRSLSKVAGIVIEPSPASESGKSLASLGYSKIELAMTVDAGYQAEAKTFAIDDFTINGVAMGAIGLKAQFTDVAPQLFGADNAGRIQAALEAGVAAVELKLVNNGLFEKALAYSAKQQGLSPDKLRSQWSAIVGQTAPVMFGGTPASLALAAEAQKFIAEPKNLTIVVKAKSGALKAGDFMAFSDPVEFAGKLDISAAANR